MVWISLSPTGLDPRTAQPVASRHTAMICSFNYFTLFLNSRSGTEQCKVRVSQRQGLARPSIFQHVKTEMDDSAEQRCAVADWADLLRHTSHSLCSRYTHIIIRTQPRLFLQCSLSLRHYIIFTCTVGSMDSSVVIVTKLRVWTRRPRNRGSIPGEGNKLNGSPKHPGNLRVPPSPPVQLATLGTIPGG